jgi:hypothetical protein
MEAKDITWKIGLYYKPTQFYVVSNPKDGSTYTTSRDSLILVGSTGLPRLWDLQRDDGNGHPSGNHFPVCIRNKNSGTTIYTPKTKDETVGTEWHQCGISTRHQDLGLRQSTAYQNLSRLYITNGDGL